jgi:hypothetical protein
MRVLHEDRVTLVAVRDESRRVCRAAASSNDRSAIPLQALP